MLQEKQGKTRNFKTLYKARQQSVNFDIPKQQNEDITVISANYNINTNQPKKRSLTPIVRRIQFKPNTGEYQQQPDIDININPSSINSKKDQGVCTNCFNNLLSKQHLQNQRLKTPKSMKNLFDFQDKVNKDQKDRILSSINKRMNLAEKAGSALPKTDEKERFINFVEEEQFTLNECTPDIQQRRAIEKYNLKEEMFNKNIAKPLYENRKVIDYYERLANANANQAIIVNNSNQYKNPYLPSINQYKSILNEQIASKKVAKQKEKLIDHELEKQVYEMNKQKHEQETKERRESFDRLRRDFIANNSNLISSKQKKSRFDKLQDISTEVKQSEEMRQENKEIRSKEREIKRIQRRQLQVSLDSQIQMKEDLLKKERQSKCNDDTNAPNIYREPIKKEEVFPCGECNKKYGKRYIFPKSEYYRLLTQQK